MRARCPYCGEKTFSWPEWVGFDTAFKRTFSRYTNRGRHVSCRWCQRDARRAVFPATDGKGVSRYVVMMVFSLLFLLLVLIVAKLTEQYAKSVAAIFLYFAVLHPLFHVFFVYFEKAEKQEIAADARMCLTVSGANQKLPLLLDGEVDLIRLPQRGTHEASPHLFGMVCGSKKNGDQRIIELRIVRTEGLELPSVGEEAWLITSGNKVIEGRITEITPGK